MADEHRKLGRCIEVYLDEKDGWVARRYVPGEPDEVHGGYRTQAEVLAVYGSDPAWPVFQLAGPPAAATNVAG